MHTKEIVDDLRHQGYAVVRDFLSAEDVPEDLVTYLSGAEKFHDGVIMDIPGQMMLPIRSRIEAMIPAVAKAMGLSIDPDNFGYCAIRVKESHDIPALRSPFDKNRDPKTAPGGALNWHLDHFSYFLFGDHKNWLICYLPVFKPVPDMANLAILPDHVVKQFDPDLHRRIQGRGALRFRCVEPDTIGWFKLRFPDEELAIGDWFAIEDLDDSTPGWKITVDLERQKVVPQLNAYDLLIMRADVIHRTNDAGCNRISVRCDALPANRSQLDTWRGLIGMTLRYPFMGKKRQYNIKIWLRKQWRQRLKRA
jgi:hypothetical protein